MINAEVALFFQWLEFLEIFKTLKLMKESRNKEIEFKPKQYQRAPLITNLLSLIILLFDFGSCLCNVFGNVLPLAESLVKAYPFTNLSIQDLYSPSYTCYYYAESMNYIIASEYTLISISFIPLFTMILVTLQRHFKSIFQRLKFKLIVLYCSFGFIQLFRLFIYLNLKFFQLELMNGKNQELQLPLYITEIIQIFIVCYILLSATTQEQRQEIENQKEEINNKNQKVAEQKRQSKLNTIITSSLIALQDQITSKKKLAEQKQKKEKEEEQKKKKRESQLIESQIALMAQIDHRYTFQNMYVSGALLNDSIESISEDSDDSNHGYDKSSQQDTKSKVQELDEPLLNVSSDS